MTTLKLGQKKKKLVFKRKPSLFTEDPLMFEVKANEVISLLKDLVDKLGLERAAESLDCNERDLYEYIHNLRNELEYNNDYLKVLKLAMM